MVNEITEPSFFTANSAEPAGSMPPIPIRNKTKIIKGFHPETPSGFLDREALAFQPLGSRTPVLSMEAAAEAKLAQITGIYDNPHPACAETRRRIHVVAEPFFCAGWDWDPEKPRIPFSADQLAKVTADINALPKPLGYDYMPVLHREAKLLIPKPIERPNDVNEMLRSFFIWRKNCDSLHDPLLIVGLFLLFFRKTLEVNFFRQFRYDLVIEAVMSWKNEFEIREDVNRIIHQGLM